MLTVEQLKAIKERAELATSGEWEVRNDNEGTEYLPFYVISEIEADSGEWFAELHVGTINDAEFIAHARQDIPELLQKIENQAKQLREQQKAIERLKESKFNLSKVAEGRKQTIKSLRKQLAKGERK